jgi:hypothetical protein
MPSQIMREADLNMQLRIKKTTNNHGRTNFFLKKVGKSKNLNLHVLASFTAYLDIFQLN